jgi:hypothetical protein
MVDNLDNETCGGCFPGIPNHSRVLGQKYTKFIVTKDRSGPEKKEMVFGVS